jgi:hypothetical protein
MPATRIHVKRCRFQPEASTMPTTAYELLQRNANIGRIRFEPSALSLHPTGPAMHDDLWWIEVTPDGIVRPHNTATEHFKDLQPADVVSADVDPDAPRDGLVYFRVRLAQQLWLHDRNAGWVPQGTRVPRVPRMSRERFMLQTRHAPHLSAANHPYR